MRDCGRGDKHGESYGDQSETITGLFILQKPERKRIEQVEELLMNTYNVALPIFMWYIVCLLKRQNGRRDANSRGTMLLLRVQLIEYHDKYMMLGDIPSYAYENFMEMYDAYHRLGGNGMVTKMYNEIQELHLKKKENNDE